MDLHIGYIMTVSNSIIGVSILAMPFCFKQCGIILAIVMLLTSSIISRLTCHFLLKSATMARRRTFELLAFHAFGTTGKIIVELGIIGFLMGTCIAFFVIIGDLAPAIIGKILEKTPTDTMRTTILVCVALFCVLPLGLLKNVESLSSVCTATIGFYFCLVLKTVAESANHFASGDWISKVELWRPIGILQCLPIFAMALSCQTQLFEIYETLPSASLEKMNYVVRVAVNICVCVYVCVGFFGYVAFASHQFTGNILMSFSPSMMTDVMKIGFILSVAFSFPLVIFPCRASLYSLLFKKGYTPYEGTSNFIPEARFKFLTLLLVGVSLIIGIMIPNIEVVLGLVGSTIGTLICIIFPATCFICISTKNTNERLVAQVMLFIGVIVMVMGTYANLYAFEEINTASSKIEKVVFPVKSTNDLGTILEAVKMDPKYEAINTVLENNKEKKNIPVIQKVPSFQVIENAVQVEEIRQEPPQPEEPQDESIPNILPTVKKKLTSKELKKEEVLKIENNINKLAETKNMNEAVTIKKPEEVDKAAIEKEDKELQEAEKDKPQVEDKAKEELYEVLKKQNEEQKTLINKQKKILEEIKIKEKELKDMKMQDIHVENEVRRKASQIVAFAKKAIESLDPNKSITDTTISTQNEVNTQQINIPTVEKQNILKNNELPSKHMIPLPIIMSSITNYKQNKENEPEKSSLENKNIDKPVAIVTDVTKQLLPTRKEEKTPELKNPPNEKTPEVQIITKSTEKNNLEVQKQSFGRDILSQASDRTPVRSKREIQENELQPSNDKCELNNEEILPNSDILTELSDSKRNIFDLAKNDIISDLQSVLKTNSMNLRRKRK